MQEVNNIQQKAISGARYNNSEIMKKVTSLKEKMTEFRREQVRSADMYDKKTQELEENKDRRAAYIVAAINLKNEALQWYAAAVAGGAAVYMLKFFANDGLYPLQRSDFDGNNDLGLDEKKEQEMQFHEVLRMFGNLETLFTELQASLKLIKEFLNVDESDEIHKSIPELWQKQQDELVNQLEQIRVDQKIDQKLGVERDKMFNAEDED